MPLKNYLQNIFRNTGARVLFVIFVSLIVITAYVLIYGYFTQLKIYEEEELMKLQAIVNTLSAQIDGDGHEALMDRYTEKDALTQVDQDSFYFELYKILSTAKANNNLTTEIYTMVVKGDQKMVCFGVSTSTDLNFRHEYTDYPQTLLDRYENGGSIPRYEDMYGSWLSAFAPIRNSAGKTVAVVQVDERFDDFIMKARRDIQRNVFISFMIMGVIAFFLFQAISRVLGYESKLRADKEEVERLRRELIANVSHDLRTPVAVIQGYVETMQLKQKEISQQQRDKYIEIILQNTNKLRKLINELFELAKLEAAGAKLDVEPFHPTELIQDVLAKFKLMADEKGVALNTNLSKNMPRVVGDIALIDRVLQNLIENAIKFCAMGDYVNIELEQKNNRVYISVVDSGPGIPDEDMPYIFERYHKGSNSQKDSSTGLGLAIVKKILDMHGSVIDIETSQAEGTRFTFCLPIHK